MYMLSDTKMASLQTTATIENLPSDVLSNILIRLFARQLAQMRCVSKSWNSLLSQSSFIKSHLHQSLHSNDKILLFFAGHYYEFPEQISAHASRSPNYEITNFLKIPVNLPSTRATVAGSVNGLICLNYGSDSGLYIWNPSISAVLTLPPYSEPPPNKNITKTHFRFGFDPKSDDYKVVKLVSIQQRQPYHYDFSVLEVKEWLQVEVYSMRNGSWKLINQRFPSHITGVMRDVVCVDGHDGHLHWLSCTDNEGKQQIIVAFDLGEETFCEIPIPDFVFVPDRCNTLGVLAGKLCVMSEVKNDECEVWVMDEYGVAESWVKRYVFSKLKLDMLFSLGFTLHNEFLYAYDKHSLGLYDPIAQNLKWFETKGRGIDVCNVVGYVDSLVWVNSSLQI